MDVSSSAECCGNGDVRILELLLIQKILHDLHVYEQIPEQGRFELWRCPCQVEFSHARQPAV